MHPLKYNLSDRTRGPLHIVLCGPYHTVSENGMTLITHLILVTTACRHAIPILKTWKIKQESQVVL